MSIREWYGREDFGEPEKLLVGDDEVSRKIKGTFLLCLWSYMGVEVTVKKGTILLCIWNNNGDMLVVFLLHKCMGVLRISNIIRVQQVLLQNIIKVQ